MCGLSVLFSESLSEIEDCFDFVDSSKGLIVSWSSDSSSMAVGLCGVSFVVSVAEGCCWVLISGCAGCEAFVVVDIFFGGVFVMITIDGYVAFSIAGFTDDVWAFSPRVAELVTFTADRLLVVVDNVAPFMADFQRVRVEPFLRIIRTRRFPFSRLARLWSALYFRWITVLLISPYG